MSYQMRLKDLANGQTPKKKGRLEAGPLSSRSQSMGLFDPLGIKDTQRT
jgi:hypothetical protein